MILGGDGSQTPVPYGRSLRWRTGSGTWSPSGSADEAALPSSTGGARVRTSVGRPSARRSGSLCAPGRLRFASARTHTSPDAVGLCSASDDLVGVKPRPCSSRDQLDASEPSPRCTCGSRMDAAGAQAARRGVRKRTDGVDRHARGRRDFANSHRHFLDSGVRFQSLRRVMTTTNRSCAT